MEWLWLWLSPTDLGQPLSPLSHACVHPTSAGRGHARSLMDEAIISNNGLQQKTAILTTQKSSSSFGSRAEQMK
ncbi:hypothetical protein ACRRTK_002850 [Alexandromys fortis]